MKQEEKNIFKNIKVDSKEEQEKLKKQFTIIITDNKNKQTLVNCDTDLIIGVMNVPEKSKGDMTCQNQICFTSSTGVEIMYTIKNLDKLKDKILIRMLGASLGVGGDNE